MVQPLLRETMKQPSIRIYLYTSSMALEGKKPEGCWQISRTTRSMQMEIRQMLLPRITPR